MDKHFDRVTDAKHLKVGDLIVVPPEPNRKRKALHLSSSSFSKLGLSVGFTCRSDNDTETVDKLLGTDDGKTHVFYVSVARQKYCYDMRQTHAQFLGNSVNDISVSTVPEITSAVLRPAPFSEDPSKNDEGKVFMHNMENDLVDLLRGHMKNAIFFGHERETYHVDAFIASAYGFFPSRPKDEMSQKYPWYCSNVPVTSDYYRGEGDMDDHTIHDFFQTEAYQFDCPSDRRDNSISASAKFLVNFVNRGALVYRPSKTFIRHVLSVAMTKAMAEYKEACNRMITAANNFRTGLENDIKRTEERIKLAQTLCEEIKTDDAVLAELSSQLKEITQ